MMRLLSALLLTYFVSRLCRRAPFRVAEPARTVIAHLASAVAVSAVVLALRSFAWSLPLPLACQGGWLLLDLARIAGVRRAR